MRIPIPEDTAAEVLFQHDHTCCICQERGRHVQMHHIDEDPTNNDPMNLAVCCTECHNDTMIRGGFGRRLGAHEVRIYRRDWVSRVAERRRRADQLLLEKQVGIQRDAVAGAAEWQPPSDMALYTFVDSIPEILKKAYELAQPEWETRATGTVTNATYAVIDVVQQVWVQLAAWYPPNQFGKPATQYFNEFLASRFEFRRALMEPEGPGTAGSMIRPMVAYGVLLDAEEAVVLTVHLLLLFREQRQRFDIDDWEKQLRSATSTYNQ